uniref:BMA-NPP-19, isoform h n=1 Tax=Brugia malayi TaxID=6279 RepID=A0A1U7EZX3_BRUMA|nr:BMA-NPP-19, isoform h [Brugia malayi]
MIADSEVSLFSDSSRLSSSNTHSQHSAPSFLFGSHSRRRSLIMSFDDSSEKRTTEQDTLTSSSKSNLYFDFHHAIVGVYGIYICYNK